MMTNKPMKAESFWYKLKRFLFKSSKKDEKTIEKSYAEFNTRQNIEVSLKNEKNSDVRELTKKVLRREIDFETLSNEEIEMISSNIKNEINKMDKEIERTKKNIADMRKNIK